MIARRKSTQGWRAIMHQKLEPQRTWGKHKQKWSGCFPNHFCASVESQCLCCCPFGNKTNNFRKLMVIVHCMHALQFSWKNYGVNVPESTANCGILALQRPWFMILPKQHGNGARTQQPAPLRQKKMCVIFGHHGFSFISPTGMFCPVTMLIYSIFFCCPAGRHLPDGACIRTRHSNARKTWWQKGPLKKKKNASWILSVLGTIVSLPCSRPRRLVGHPKGAWAAARYTESAACICRRMRASEGLEMPQKTNGLKSYVAISLRFHFKHLGARSVHSKLQDSKISQ